MNTTEALETLWAAVVTDVPLVKREQALDVMRALLRRDWAVRVLDAWAPEWYLVGHKLEGNYGDLFRLSGAPVSVGWDRSRDAARHAAALAVFTTLDRNAPNWPGECP